MSRSIYEPLNLWTPCQPWAGGAKMSARSLLRSAGADTQRRLGVSSSGRSCRGEMSMGTGAAEARVRELEKAPPSRIIYGR